MKTLKAERMVGKTFGRLTVTGAIPSKWRKTTWYCACVCECGRACSASPNALIVGHTKSCGCFHLDQAASMNKSHGQWGSKTYQSWAAMKQRCLTPTSTKWKDYGGRGIKIYERWLYFENFLADMGERPEGKTLDRIDVDGNYEPSNCRWATRSEQQQNRRPRINSCECGSCRKCRGRLSARLRSRRLRCVAG